MADIPKPSNNVLRRNADQECGTPVGQINVSLLRSVRGFETISFYCNQPRLHLGECMFVGKDVIVRSRQDRS